MGNPNIMFSIQMSISAPGRNYTHTRLTWPHLYLLGSLLHPWPSYPTHPKELSFPQGTNQAACPNQKIYLPAFKEKEGLPNKQGTETAPPQPFQSDQRISASIFLGKGNSCLRRGKALKCSGSREVAGLACALGLKGLILIL